MQSKPRNYLKGQESANKTRVLVRALPDSTIHNPSGALYALGGLGILAGIGANIWQLLTTFTAFWTLFNPRGTPVDPGKQPVIFAICALIAFSFQLALLMLVFRLDTSWKKHKVSGQPLTAKGAVQQVRSTAVELGQHVTLAGIWGALGFVVDTIGDFTFISIYTANLDPATGTFLMFIYTVALYALSTIAFVRSLEYIWAGFAASDNWKRDHQSTAKTGGEQA